MYVCIICIILYVCNVCVCFYLCANLCMTVHINVNGGVCECGALDVNYAVRTPPPPDMRTNSVIVPELSNCTKQN